MSKKYPNMNDSNGEENEELRPKRRSLNPFENLYRKDGPGVEKDEVKVLDKPGIANFFKLFRRKLNQIFSCNILLIFGNFPVLFAMAALAYTTIDINAPQSQLYPAIMGSAYFDSSPVITALLGVFGKQTLTSVMTPATTVLLCLSLLVLVTFGLVNVGTTYILRNILRGEPVSVWSDFWYAVKRNLRQGIILGIIDLLCGAMLLYSCFSYRMNLGGPAVFSVFYVATYCMIVMYLFIRMYIYLMVITFDMSVFKIIKNGIFFSVLGIKRNVMALLGIALLVILDFYLLNLFLPIGVVVLLIILFGMIQYICVYAAYPKIKEIMIDPYYKEVKEH